MNELMNRPQGSDAIQELEVLDRSDGNVDLEQSLEGIQGDDRAIAKAYFSEERGLDYT